MLIYFYVTAAMLLSDFALLILYNYIIYVILQFFSIVSTHFFENLPHTLRTLYTNIKTYTQCVSCENGELIFFMKIVPNA